MQAALQQKINIGAASLPIYLKYNGRFKYSPIWSMIIHINAIHFKWKSLIPLFHTCVILYSFVFCCLILRLVGCHTNHFMQQPTISFSQNLAIMKSVSRHPTGLISQDSHLLSTILLRITFRYNIPVRLLHIL